MNPQDLFGAFETAQTAYLNDTAAVATSQAKLAAAQADVVTKAATQSADIPALNAAADALIAAITAAKIDVSTPAPTPPPAS
jgi:hypothetical protein